VTEPRYETARLLLALFGGPIAWTLHLFAGYALVPLWCANGWEGVEGILGVLTVFAFAAAGASGVLAFDLLRRSRRAVLSDEPGGSEVRDAQTAERAERMIFLSVIALFLAALFAFLILWQGSPVLVPDCRPAPAP